jgi:magnesium chelatase subunit I
VLSNAERRALGSGDKDVVARIADIYAAIPAITGKIELEYEGELKGAESIARDLIRQSVQMIFRQHFPSADFKPVIDWFELGGNVKFSDVDSPENMLTQMAAVHGLLDKTQGSPALKASLGEFILEGLHALDKLGRSEERGFTATERKAAQDLYRDYTMDRNRHKKPLN